MLLSDSCRFKFPKNHDKFAKESNTVLPSRTLAMRLAHKSIRGLETEEIAEL